MTMLKPEGGSPISSRMDGVELITPITGQPMSLSCGDAPEVVLVLGVEDDTLVLADGPGDGPARVVFSTPRGVVELVGTLDADGGSSRRLTIVETRRLQQRRALFRLAVACPVRVVRSDADSFVVSTVDLSLGGMLVANAPALRLDEPVQVTVELGEHGDLAAQARVVRAEGEHRALRFEGLSERGEDRLAQFLAADQRRRRLGTPGGSRARSAPRRSR